MHNIMQAAVPDMFFTEFSKRYRGNELENLLKNAMVTDCRASCAQIKNFGYL